MNITILSVGKRNDPWIEAGIQNFTKRLRPPFAYDMSLIPPVADSTKAREEESQIILKRLKPDDFVILLDERGENFSSPEIERLITARVGRQLVFVIGGAFGVNDAVRARANTVWSLSKLVFPHQIVRLLLVEQLYRSQEIFKHSGYHHE